MKTSMKGFCTLLVLIFFTSVSSPSLADTSQEKSEVKEEKNAKGQVIRKRIIYTKSTQKTAAEEKKKKTYDQLTTYEKLKLAPISFGIDFGISTQRADVDYAINGLSFSASPYFSFKLPKGFSFTLGGDWSFSDKFQGDRSYNWDDTYLVFKKSGLFKQDPYWLNVTPSLTFVYLNDPTAMGGNVDGSGKLAISFSRKFTRVYTASLTPSFTYYARTTALSPSTLISKTVLASGHSFTLTDKASISAALIYVHSERVGASPTSKNRKGDVLVSKLALNYSFKDFFSASLYIKPTLMVAHDDALIAETLKAFPVGVNLSFSIF